VVGLPVAALWPLALPSATSSRIKAGLLAVASAAYVAAPLLPSGRSIVLVALVPVLTCVLVPTEANGENPFTHRLPPRPLLGILGLAALTAGIVDWDQTKNAVETFIEDDAAAIAVSAFFACVFIGGTLVAWILSPFTGALNKAESSRQSLANAGRYIGWFERTVLFAFVMGGEPQAAAIALAAKSFARFPTLRDHEEGFAEYFLIGSLVSIAIAVGAAIGTRAALGIGPF
jgi:uncharacterized membrane protein